MRALSVRQPWASLIAVGLKTIEVRSRPWQYRGPLVICATAHDITVEGEDGKPLDLPYGVVTCTVDMMDCRPLALADVDASMVDDIAPHIGKWAWVLGNAREVEPVRVKGHLAPWEWVGPRLMPCANHIEAWHEALTSHRQLPQAYAPQARR